MGSAALPGDILTHAFLWSKGEMEDLGTLGGDSSLAYWINNRHQVVGTADTSVLNPLSDFFISHAFFDERGVMIDMGALGGNSIATAINDRGQVTGVSEISKVPDPDPKFGGTPPFHAFVWEDGMMTDLGGFQREITQRTHFFGHMVWHEIWVLWTATKSVGVTASTIRVK